MATSKRAKKIAEICKAGITKELTGIQTHVGRYVDYAVKAGRDPKEIHLSNKQFDAIIADKLRVEARVPSSSGVQHREDGPYMGNIKLLPTLSGRTQEYLDAHLPSE